MRTNPANIDDEQALIQLLGVGEGSPVATPSMLVKLAQWLRIGDIMRIYGVSKSQAFNWVRRLREEKKVRVQTPIYGLNGKGDTFYSAKGIEAAFTENANRLMK